MKKKNFCCCRRTRHRILNLSDFPEGRSATVTTFFIDFSTHTLLLLLLLLLPPTFVANSLVISNSLRKMTN